MKPRQFLLLSWIFCFSLTTISCRKYLQIEPEDQFMEKTVFSNEIMIDNALNGIYVNMAKRNLYGANMTMTTIDVMGQYYNMSDLSSTDKWSLLAEYKYEESIVRNDFSAIWIDSYKVILNINNFIERLNDVSNTVLSDKKKSILLGEAYGLRAFLHFDLLRLFGPVYGNNASAPSIPYVIKASKDIQPLLPANEVISNVSRDLTTAIKLLENDPVRSEGIQQLSKTAGPIDNFYKMRNRRMNYFAVKGLQARVALYAGDKPAALNHAKSLIAETFSFFPWSNPLLSLPAIENPDRIFSSEVIFGLENVSLSDVQREYFSSAIQITDILAANPDRLTTLYSNENDYRYRSSWLLDQTSTKSFKTFFKFSEVSDKSSTARFFQPLLRISELYYIAAECETDPAKARFYLNTVRSNRGLADISAIADLNEELMDEYRREFWGEGQTFFYFKRKNKSTIPNGSDEGNEIKMTPPMYIVPLPLIETDNR